MNILVKNKNTLIFDDFEFKCCIGKYGLSKSKREGDGKTPKGFFKLGKLYFRKDRNKELFTKLKKISIKKEMGWCNDSKSHNYNSLIKRSKKLKHNRLIKLPSELKHEKMFRRDGKYDLLIPIKYNMKKPIRHKGSAIFLHLTKNYSPTAGCIALKKKDFLILLKLINKNTKIKII